jgi:hypothetical protein
LEHTEYIPGLCNIGREEIAARKTTGWVGLALTVVIMVVLISLKAGAAWYALIFVSSSVGALGFIQAKMRFCAAFGMRHVFNFSSRVGSTESVMQRELWAADRRKALQISAYALLAGLFSTGVALSLRYVV